MGQQQTVADTETDCYAWRMEAISKLVRSGMTRKQIALSIGLSEPTLIGMYERGERFPGRENYRAIVDLADSRGLTLLARDFVLAEKQSRATCQLSTPRAKAA
jgi:transcriptional regulator with XRE-family HTH domain